MSFREKGSGWKNAANKNMADGEPDAQASKRIKSDEDNMATIIGEADNLDETSGNQAETESLLCSWIQRTRIAPLSQVSPALKQERLQRGTMVDGLGCQASLPRWKRPAVQTCGS